jgi:hypothetical protein
MRFAEILYVRWAPDDPVADILADLQFKLRRVPTIWTSRLHEPSRFKAHRAHQFFNAPGPASGV